VAGALLSIKPIAIKLTHSLVFSRGWLSGCIAMQWRTEKQPVEALARRRVWTVRRRRAGAWTGAIAAHALVLVALASAWPEARATFDPEATTVAFVTLQPPPPRPKPLPRPLPLPPKPVQAKAAPPKAAPPRPAPLRALARETPAPAHVAMLSAAAVTAPNPSQGVSDAELAGAGTAESGDGGGGGGGGRPCNMARRLQDALRKDPLVQTTVSGLGGKALRVWNGDWVWIDGEDGKGITAVRQAMMWEIAFAPPECRTQPMHGLVVLAAGSARLVVGGGDWKWSDLLTPHPGAARD
jgi:hypothetical protein